MKNRHRQPSVVAHIARPCIYDSPISNLPNADKCAIVHSNAVAAPIFEMKNSPNIFSYTFAQLFASLDIRHFAFAHPLPPPPPTTQILIESMQFRFYYFPFTPNDWITAQLQECLNRSVITLRTNRYPSRTFHFENKTIFRKWLNVKAFFFSFSTHDDKKRTNVSQNNNTNHGLLGAWMGDEKWHFGRRHYIVV